jgi:hypothetical protein
MDKTPTLDDLRKKAKDDVDAFAKRFEDYRTAYGKAVGDQVDLTRQYVDNVLTDATPKPADWIRNGLALWIRGYSTGKQLYDLTYNLFAPAPTPATSAPPTPATPPTTPKQ